MSTNSITNVINKKEMVRDTESVMKIRMMKMKETLFVKCVRHFVGIRL